MYKKKKEIRSRLYVDEQNKADEEQRMELAESADWLELFTSSCRLENLQAPRNKAEQGFEAKSQVEYLNVERMKWW